MSSRSIHRMSARVLLAGWLAVALTLSACMAPDSSTQHQMEVSQRAASPIVEVFESPT